MSPPPPYRHTGDYRADSRGNQDDHYQASKVDRQFSQRGLRCPMLAINPKMLPRLDEIEDDLLARRARAEHEAWIGEVEGIDITLTYLRQKRDETERLARIAPVDLGMPVIAKPR